MRIIFLFLLLFSSSSFSKQVLIGYPETRSFYSTFYNDLILGIKQSLSAADISHQTFHVINMKTDPATILLIAKANHADGIILLGAAGLRLAQLLTNKTKIPIITGSNNVSPKNTGVSGVSLLTNPQTLLDFVHRLLRNHQQLVMVANPRNNPHYFHLCAQISTNIGFNFLIKQANSLHKASKQYDDIFLNLRKDKDVLWIPIDPTVMETGTLFPSILMRAWKSKIPIISNSLSHFGVMVGSYPAPVKYGEQISNLLITRIKDGDKWRNRVEFAESSRLSFNAIYASHLGIRLPPSMRNEVSIVYE